MRGNRRALEYDNREQEVTMTPRNSHARNSHALVEYGGLHGAELVQVSLDSPFQGNNHVISGTIGVCRTFNNFTIHVAALVTADDRIESMREILLEISLPRPRKVSTQVKLASVCSNVCLASAMNRLKRLEVRNL